MGGKSWRLEVGGSGWKVVSSKWSVGKWGDRETSGASEKGETKTLEGGGGARTG